MADTSKILDGESGGSPQTQPTRHGERDRRKTGAPRTGTARAVLYALVATGLLVLSPIGAGLAAASPPSLSPTVNNTTAVGGTPFTYTVSFTVTGAPEADPITVTDTPDSANPGLTILSVPLQADPNWDCSGTNINAQMVSCTYTPAVGSPLAVGTVLSIVVNAETAYPSGAPLSTYQTDDLGTFSSGDAGTVGPQELTVFDVQQTGLTIGLNLSDSLGTSHAATTGSSFDYLANVSISSGGLGEAQPITLTDPLPAGTVLTGEPTGDGWDCSASVLTSPSKAVCTYTPPRVGTPQTTTLPTILEPAQLSDTNVGDVLPNTAQVTSSDRAGSTATDSVTVGNTATSTFTVTMAVSGTLLQGSSSPAFDYAVNDSAVTLTGSLTCTTLSDAGAIGASLAVGTYTIDGGTCGGLSAGAGIAIDYVGATNEFFVSSTAPQINGLAYTYTTVAGAPFMDTPGFQVIGAPEAQPVTVVVAPDTTDYPGITILSVPAQSNWNCGPLSPTQTVTCVYTPPAPIPPLTPGSIANLRTLSVEEIAPYSLASDPSTSFVASDLGASSPDGGTFPVQGEDLIGLIPAGVNLDPTLTDTLGPGHSATTGTGFDYQARVTVDAVQPPAQYVSPETQPVTFSDTLPAGVKLTAEPHGMGWDCSASVVSTSNVNCTYTPPPVGMPAGSALPTIYEPAQITDGTAGDTLTNSATVSSSDTAGGTGSDSVTVVSSDSTAPTVTNVAAAPMLTTLGNGTVLSATVADTETGGTDVVAAQYSVNGGSWTPMSGSFGSPTVNVTATPPIASSPEADTLCVRGEDGAGNWSDGTSCTSFVVYNPTGGFVTGGGWLTSPSGACLDTAVCGADAYGKATFGFVSKYLKGATVPTGNTQYVFHAGDLNFASSTYQWLVVNQNGTNAQFKGNGTINGTGNYTFMIWATAGTPDTFRIEITNSATDATVYDSGAQSLGGGSIIIHT